MMSIITINDWITIMTIGALVVYLSMVGIITLWPRKEERHAKRY